MTLKEHIKNHFFFYSLAVAVLLAITASYSRFIIKNDYIVFYEGECDPYQQSCFIGCADDDCLEEYFYSKIEKNAHDIYAQCGNSILGCPAANTCLPSDTTCSIKYCDETKDKESCKKIVTIPENILEDEVHNLD